MITYQEYQNAPDKVKFIWDAVINHRVSEDFVTARDAQEYDHQQNVSIKQTSRTLYNMSGVKTVDYTAANNQLASPFFHILARERASYSLGNGITWAKGAGTQKKLGDKFDRFIYDAARAAVVDGVVFGFWNVDHGDIFRLTEFVPMWDEIDGTLRAGIRFWSIDWGNKPVTCELYEEDGYTIYRSKDANGVLEEVEPKRGYIQIVARSQAEGERIIGESNYSALPIVPMYVNKDKRSLLVGVRPLIDAYDMIQSGFCNDLQECAQIFWLIGNAQGMEPDDLARFRDQLKFLHIAAADTENSSVTPYTQEVPHAARTTCLESLRRAIYDSAGIFDATGISAGSKTATEIQAAYQAMDEEADDFEYWVTAFIKQVLKLNNIDDYPDYKRNRISNQPEQTNMILSAANYLDNRTLLTLLPFIDNGQIDDILAAKDEEEGERIENTPNEPKEEPEG